MEKTTPYIPKNKIRIVTAASLFDGHDAAINVMRRIIQSTGVEVIHLGHDRSVEEGFDRVHSVLQALTEAVMLIDSDRRLVLANPSARHKNCPPST